MTIEPGIKDFTIYQGATFQHILTWKDQNNNPVNLSGYTARMQCRSSLAGVVKIFELTTANGGITLGGSAGTISLLLSDDATAALNAESGVYDLELEDSAGTTTRLLQGQIIFNKEVTR